MNLLKKSLLASSLMLASAATLADNTTTATVHVHAYIAAGLSVEVEPLVFADIVIPSTNDEHKVTIVCEDGTLSYDNDNATPNGKEIAAASANANVDKTDTLTDFGPQAGKITISGEADYAYAAGYEVANNNTGVVFNPLFSINGGDPVTSFPADLVLTDGSTVITVCGSLVVKQNAVAGPTDIEVELDINYR